MADEVKKNIEVIIGLVDNTKGTIKRITTGIKSIDNSLKRTGVQIRKFRREFKASLEASKVSITEVGIAATALGAGISAGFGVAIKGAGEFEHIMSSVEAVSGATGQSLQDLTDIALDMGRTTRYTAVQAAEGLKFMSMAGLEASEQLTALPSVLQLAAAGNLELGRAADITTNIMTAYGFAAKDLVQINDVMVKAFTSSNSTLEELGEAFKYVGPIAKAAGVEFTDLVGALGSLHDAGIKGSMAGTTLRSSIDALLNPTAEEVKLMGQLAERMGGTALEINDAAGNFVGFQRVIEQLEDSGIGAGEALKLFGLRAGPGMLALIGQGSDALDDFNYALEMSGGTAARIAEVMEDNFYGALTRTKSAISGLAISIGNNFLPILTTLFEALSDIINVITEFHEALGPLAGGIEFLIAVLGILLVVVGSLTIGWRLLVTPILAATTAFQAAAASAGLAAFSLKGLGFALRAAAIKARAFMSAIGPVGWILLAVSLAVGVLISWYYKHNKSAEEVIAKEKAIQEVLGKVQHQLERYRKKAAQLVEGSERWVKNNLKLRESLIKMGEGQDELAEAARRAGEQIDAETGKILDQGEALSYLQKLTQEKMYESTIAELEALGDQLEATTNDANFLVKLFSSSEAYAAGTKSFKQIKEEVQGLGKNTKRLTDDQKELKEQYFQTVSAAEKFLTALEKTGKIDFSGTAEDLNKLTEIIWWKGLDFSDVTRKAVQNLYEERVARAKKSNEVLIKTEEDLQSEMLTSYINGHDKLIKTIEQKAIERSQAVRLSAAKVLQSDSLTAADREKIARDTAEKLRQIESAKLRELLADAEKYKEVLLATGAEEQKQQKAADREVEISNAVKEARITHIAEVTDVQLEAQKKMIEEQEAQMEHELEMLTAHVEMAQDKLSELYEKGGMSVQAYYEQRIEKVKQLQDKEIETLGQQEEAETNLAAKKRITDEIDLTKLEHAKELKNIMQEQVEEENRLAEQKKKNELEIAALRAEVAQTEVNADDALTALELRHEEERRLLELHLQEQVELYRQAGAEQEQIDEMIELNHRKTNAKILEQDRALHTARLEMAQGMSASIEQTFTDLYKASGEKIKEFFLIAKAAAIAQTIMTTYEAAMKAYSAMAGIPYVGPALGAAAAAVAVAGGLAKVAIISSQSLAEGGKVQGWSPHSKADNVPISATAGEYMQPVSAVKYYGLNAMNAIRQKLISKDALNALLGNGRGIRRMASSYALAEGGPVPEMPDIPEAQEKERPLNIFNILDENVFNEFLSKTEGQERVINVISENAYEVKTIIERQ